MSRAHEFGLRLKAVRKEKRITQEKLAELIDRSVDAISSIERGINLPSYDTIARLSEKLHIPMSVLNSWLHDDLHHMDEERMLLEARLSSLVNSLDTRFLKVAVEQISVLAHVVGRTDRQGPGQYRPSAISPE